MIFSWLIWVAKIVACFLVIICGVNWYIQTNYGLTASQERNHTGLDGHGPSKVDGYMSKSGVPIQD